jgi:hypothetical protein
VVELAYVPMSRGKTAMASLQMDVKPILPLLVIVVHVAFNVVSTIFVMALLAKC